MKMILRNLMIFTLVIWGAYALYKSGSCGSCSVCPVEKICVKK